MTSGLFILACWYARKQRKMTSNHMCVLSRVTVTEILATEKEYKETRFLCPKCNEDNVIECITE